MSVLHHPRKANVVEDYLSRLSMESVAHVEDDKNELVYDVHRLDRVSVRLVDSNEGVVVVHNCFESYFFSDVKARQDVDHALVYLKKSVYEKSIEAFFPNEDKESFDIKVVYWWNRIKKDFAEFMAKCLNCEHVKVEHQNLGGKAQDISILTWKWEDLNMDFITGLPRTHRQFYLIWVNLDQMTKMAHFLPVKTSF
ncbi:uncharacterized protein [Solanum tuberosum]|uniref:uncharacterized protein n=1 Tax=Solanum tuberosum TaxID=4113 RepID=UPI00073A50D1|nr:PREDICTED: uncharacterized protein LOC107063150 [Solanum tuberosum]